MLYLLLFMLFLFWKPSYYLVRIYYYKEESFKDDLKNWFTNLWNLVNPRKLEDA